MEKHVSKRKSCETVMGILHFKETISKGSGSWHINRVGKKTVQLFKSLEPDQSETRRHFISGVTAAFSTIVDKWPKLLTAGPTNLWACVPDWPWNFTLQIYSSQPDAAVSFSSSAPTFAVEGHSELKSQEALDSCLDRQTFLPCEYMHVVT